MFVLDGMAKYAEFDLSDTETINLEKKPDNIFQCLKIFNILFRILITRAI